MSTYIDTVVLSYVYTCIRVDVYHIIYNNKHHTNGKSTVICNNHNTSKHLNTRYELH